LIGARSPFTELAESPAKLQLLNRRGRGDAMRLKSGLWVAAYMRRCEGAGAYGAVRRRGADEAGAIFIKVNRLDGTADLYGPAPQTAFDDARPVDRAFVACLKVSPAPEADVELFLSREIKFDPDVWIVEIEDRQGRHFIDQLVR
jgi:hypothetical protein